MAEIDGNLAKYQSVVLDSNGNGSIEFAVDNAWQRWVVDSVRVSTSQVATQTPFPSVEIFTSAQSPGFSQGATWTGNSDTFTGEAHTDVGSDLIVSFTGGIPGSTAYARVYGKRYTRIS